MIKLKVNMRVVLLLLIMMLVIMMLLITGCGSGNGEAKDIKNQEESMIRQTERLITDDEKNNQNQDGASAPLHRQINLERKTAQNVEELAQIIKDVIKEMQNVEECYVVGSGEEVSRGGYWLSAEVKLKNAEDAWQVARNGVLTAYLNKGDVRLVKISVNIMVLPEDRMYALQVLAGENHFDDEILTFLKDATYTDFQIFIEENQIKGEHEQYGDDLWAQGPLS